MKYLSSFIIFIVILLVGLSTSTSLTMIHSKEIQVNYPFKSQITQLKYRFYDTTDTFIAYQIDSLLETP